MILVKLLIILLLMLMLAHLYKYFNNKEEEKAERKQKKLIEGFSEYLPEASANTNINTNTNPEQVPPNFEPALQFSAAKKASTIELETTEPMVPFIKNNKIEEATEKMQMDLHNNPLIEDMWLKIKELEKLGNEALDIKI